MKVNKIYNEDCMETMARMPDNFVDLTVTSPPYDNLRTYKDDIDKTWGAHVWKPIIKELYRVTKKGGVVVWVVNDATIKGSETGTSFRQVLFFKEIGFNIHDTMIYRKKNYVPLTHNRYEQEFEYLFVLSKGKPKTFNPIMIPCKYAGQETWGHASFHKTNASGLVSVGKKKINKEKQHGNIFEYLTGRSKNDHPAPMPEKLAQDQINTWSNKQDLVYDPFAGSGTTAKMSIINNRTYIGSEISKEYCKIIRRRLDGQTPKLF